MSSSRVLTNNQEVFLNFLNTHLGMVALLMPWKKLVDTTTDTTKTKTIEHLITLFDMVLQDPKKWMIGVDGAGKLDDTLEGKVHVFLGMTAALLFVLIIGFASSLYYPREVTYRFGIDLVGLILGATTLILAVTFQSDFDAHWKWYATQSTPSTAHPYPRIEGYERDYKQAFLVIGVLAGQIVISLGLVGDKLREVLEKWRI